MALIKWNSDANLLPAISGWLDDFFPDTNEMFRPALRGASLPAVNITENNDAFNVKVAAPGFKKEDFKLELHNGYLTISGETKEEKEDQNERYTRQEYRYSSFNRSFTLPENVRAEEIAAEYNDGILKVTLPKKKTEEKPKQQIAVK